MEISDLGFEMQDSSNLNFPVTRDSSSMLLPAEFRSRVCRRARLLRSRADNAIDHCPQRRHCGWGRSKVQFHPKTEHGPPSSAVLFTFGRPAATHGAQKMNEPSRTANATISHYRILSRIGAGGIGEAYLARDTKLDRTVALKILPAGLAADPERMRRFVQEVNDRALPLTSCVGSKQNRG